MEYRRIKGTNDFYDDSAAKIRYVEKEIRHIFEKFDFTEIITPIIEKTEIFVRSAGDGSDIVTKEMYTFKDKGDHSITLRPEGTAGVVRSFLENKLYATSGIKKLYYIGPMFRYERPQAGRYRQFIQCGVEAFGDSSYLLDVDIIASAYQIFDKLGLKNVKLVINTIGDLSSRKAYAEALKQYFSDKLDLLCDDCKRRFEKNPLRILDCKVDKDSDILKNVPKIYDSLTEEAKVYFTNITNALSELGIRYTISETLVRGLDYYTDVVFEYVLDDDSSLNGLAICAGGKYSELVSSFGGPSIPGIGYAFGLERIVLTMEHYNLFPDTKNTIITLITLDDKSKIHGLDLAFTLRAEGFIVNMDYKNNSLKPQFRLAEKSNADYIIIIGEEERINKNVSIKDTNTGEQITIPENEIIQYIQKEKIK